MALHVRHTAVCSTERQAIASALVLLLIVACYVFTVGQHLYTEVQDRHSVQVVANLSPEQEEEVPHLMHLASNELPEAPPLLEPYSPEIDTPELTISEAEIIQGEEDEAEFFFSCFTPGQLMAQEEPPTPPPAIRKLTPTHSQKSTYTPPRYAATPQPSYPKELLRKRLTGTVRVRIRIADTGKATAVEVLSATHPAFAQSARRTILQSWRFTPATEGGKAVISSVTTTIYFKL